MKPIRRDMVRWLDNRPSDCDLDFWVRLKMGYMPRPGAEIPVILEEVKYNYG